MKTRIVSVLTVTLLTVLMIGFATSRASAILITDDATGGDCTTVGDWDAGTKTCTLEVDLVIPLLPSGRVDGIDIVAGGVTFDCDGHSVSGPAVFGRGVGSNGVTIFAGADGVTVKGCKFSLFRNGVLAFLGSMGHTITGNDIHDTRSGIVMFQSNGFSTIANNNIHDTFRNGILLTQDAGSNNVTGNTIRDVALRGIGGFFTAGANTITHNTLSGAIVGVSLIQTGGSNLIADNTISQTRVGVTIEPTGDFNIIDSNDIEVTEDEPDPGGEFGILIEGSGPFPGGPFVGPAFTEITNNIIRQTGEGFGGGIVLTFGFRDSLIHGNDVDATHTGIQMDVQVNGNVFSSNKVRATFNGISMESGSGVGNDDNVFLDNNITAGRNGLFIQLGKSNHAEGNVIRHSGEAGIVVDQSEDTELLRNVVHKNGADGLKLLSSPTTNVSLNDIFLNGGFGVNSNAPIELSVDGMGNWWQGNCGKGLFVAGEDSNSLDVVDSNPYSDAVAHIPDPDQPEPCPDK